MSIKRCKLSKKIQDRLLEYFVLEVTARSAADILSIHPNTAALFYHKIREVITYHLDQEAEMIVGGEIEVDESYFGGVRKGNRGRGAAGKTIVFGLLKRQGKVFTIVVADVSSDTLVPIIKRKVAADSIVYTDNWKAYNALDVSDFHHQRINHSIQYVDGGNRRNHINGIENFWNQAKRVLRKYNGIPKNHFPLFLKECEFRFNYGTPKQQLNLLKIWCK